MLVLSATIAAAGLLGDSTATVTGAMIIAPLSTPIMGIALAAVTGRGTGAVLLASTGAIAVVAVCLGLGRFAYASGALLLFLSNLVALVLCGIVVFAMLGYVGEAIATNDRPGDRRTRVTLIVLTIAVVVPLGLIQGVDVVGSTIRIAGRAPGDGWVGGLGHGSSDRTVLGLAAAQRNNSAALVIAASLGPDVVVRRSWPRWSCRSS